jgi:hypothetical protein
MLELTPNYNNAELNRDFGKDVDSLISIKQKAKYDLVSATTKLMEMGTVVISGNKIVCSPRLSIKDYVKCNHQEYAWEAEYEDGTIIAQFQGEEQHHFGHIDQEKLSKFRWISNFECSTSNLDKRAIVELDFKTGKFSFLNGFAPQEIRALTDDIYPRDEKAKLIMKMVKRQSNVVSFPDNTISETYRYNRYLIGWETKSKKVLLCIEPSGFVHLWYN